VADCLVLEDERIVRNLVTLILRQNRHSVRQAGTPDDAEGICQKHSIDLLVADVKLSDGRSGTEFALRLVQAQPKIKCLFISGLPIENWTKRDQYNAKDMPEGSYAALCKPLSPEVLLKAIDDLLRPFPA
jgi:two-component SAPR family response regulator